MIRKAQSEDLGEITRIYVDAWKQVYAGIMPEEFLNNMRWEGQVKKWQAILDQGKKEIYVFEVDGKIAGFASGSLTDSTHAEIETLYFDVPYRGKGYGSRMLDYMLHDFGKGRRVSLWCVKENPNRVFYEVQGGKPGLEKKVTIGGKEITGIQFSFE